MGASAPLLALLTKGQLFTLVTRFDEQGGRMLCYANGHCSPTVPRRRRTFATVCRVQYLQVGEYFDPMRGTIAEILIYNKALYDAERNRPRSI